MSDNAVTAVLPVVPAEEKAPRRRTRALRLTVVPSFHTGVQVVCAAVGLYGTYLKFGLSITLIVGACVGAAVSMLREGGKI